MRRFWLPLLVGLLIAPSTASALALGVEGSSFTLDRKPVFLLGASYYGGLAAPEESVEADLKDLAARGFNWIRVWATWATPGLDVSAITPEGKPREPYFGRLKRLIERAAFHGLVVDVTLTRGQNAASGRPLLEGQSGHLEAMATLARELTPYRNVTFDLANERDVRDARYVPVDELRALRARVRAIDPERLVTASHGGGDLGRKELAEDLEHIGLDFVTPHRPRHAGSPAETEAASQRMLAAMRELGRGAAPLHYQEPFRRDYGDWQPSAVDFLSDLLAARRGSAAGWCFHNGSPRRGRSGPSRSFDLRAEQGRLFAQLDAEEQHVVARAAFLLGSRSRTWITVAGSRWHLNGGITYPGAEAEGLLLNARMVNAIFEDRNPATAPAGFDPERNTAELIAALPDYAAHGLRALTLFLQGGMPGYEGALNSAFEADGALRASYMSRAARCIEAADTLGMAVILGLYYQRQDQVLKDEAAVRRGVREVARWIREQRYGHVLLEIANEYPHSGFNHLCLREPSGIASLIREAQTAAPGLLVSASGIGDGKSDREVAEAADFLLIHFNGVPVKEIPARIETLRGFGKAIVCNEDDKLGAEGARAAEAAVRAGCSWGLMLERHNQHAPFRFEGAKDDPAIYAALKRLASEPKAVKREG